MHTQNCGFVITENWWCFVMFGHSGSWLCWRKCIVWIKAWSEWKCFTSKWNFWLAPPHSERILQSELPGYSHQCSCSRSFWSCLSKWHQAIRVLLQNTQPLKWQRKTQLSNLSISFHLCLVYGTELLSRLNTFWRKRIKSCWKFHILSIQNMWHWLGCEREKVL